MSPIFSLEICLPVSDYHYPDQGENAEDAFEEVREALNDAADVALNDLAEWIGKDAIVCELLKVEFVEFDSSNVSHAGAYFKATFRGPEDIVEFFLNLEIPPDDLDK